ncbi:MAG TPA: hypothetical protein DIS90_07170 [Cytophagales bacterium]|nr:hypothetical protein [Cytophagales bacterium]HCR53031.1 hypothetical protein [Cytophagales bacterium]
MNQESDSLSPHQSLDLIQSMIRQAQGNMSNNSFYFILWGWVVVIANLGMYSMIKYTEFQYPHYVWLIAIPAWIVTMVYGSRQGRKQRRTSHLDKINMWLWIGFGVCLLPFIVFITKVNYNINPIILIITSLPTFVTGVMLRFKPLIWGGISFYVFGIICFLMSPIDQFLIGAIAIACGYLIPGYLLKATKEKNV